MYSVCVTTCIFIYALYSQYIYELRGCNFSFLREVSLGNSEETLEALPYEFFGMFTINYCSYLQMIVINRRVVNGYQAFPSIH